MSVTNWVLDGRARSFWGKARFFLAGLTAAGTVYCFVKAACYLH